MRPLQFSLAIAAGILFSALTALAWTGPTATPPNNNVEAPINVSANAQTKSGSIGVLGNLTLAGAGGSYLNFGATSGINGYGIRDNGGTLEFKNTGGSWYSMNTVVSNYLVLNGLTMTSGTATFNGNVYATGYFHTSDARLKTNIQTLDGLDIVQKLRGVSFDWKKDGAPSAGVIAQEVERVMPSAVHTDANGMKSVDYDQLVGPLIEAVKAQQGEIDGLTKEVEALKSAR